MPHVVVKMYKGRTEEQKQAMTEAVSNIDRYNRLYRHHISLP